jgi:hypothetical protein
VIRGCSGNVDELVELYLQGKVTDSGLGCSEHECGDKDDKIDVHNLKLNI